MYKKIRLGTLFSGVGAAELAAINVWGKENTSISFACEIDKFARQTYKENYSINHTDYGVDAFEFDATPYKGKTDIFVAGFPCQPFSNGGLKKGFCDTRGTLFHECTRVIRETEPEMFILENVNGLVWHDKNKDEISETKTVDIFGDETTQTRLLKKAVPIFSIKHKDKEIGRTMKVIEEELEKTGYYWNWEVLNALDFGLPQSRARVFMVGFKNKKVFDAFKFPTGFKLRKTLGDYLDKDVDESYFLKARHLVGMKFFEKPIGDNIKIVGRVATGGERGVIISPTSCSPCLTAAMYKDPIKIEVIGQLAKSSLYPFDTSRRIHGTHGASPTITTVTGGGQEIKIANKDRVVRKLTPSECFRLQGFPSDFKLTVSKSQQYKQAGNSIAINVMSALYTSIKKAFKVSMKC